MQIEGLDKVITGILMFAIGIGIVVKSRTIAKVCSENKAKMFGENKYDYISEGVTRSGIILIGILGILGSFLTIYRCFK